MDFQWGYSNFNGPHTWSKYFTAASGCRQSPVNINRKSVTVDETLKSSHLTVNVGPDHMTKQTLVHTGHNFQVQAQGTAYISGGPLGQSRYSFVQCHFHWGTSDTFGSEHQIDGKSFPSELHMVFWNSGKYSSIKEAETKPDGLAVLGIFLELGEDNADLKPLINALDGFTDPGRSDVLQPMVDLSKLIPNISHYFTYPGSLTTPPCYESVTWIVFKDTVKLSRSQLDAFRMTHSKDDCCTTDNYRAPVPLGNRPLKVPSL